MEPSLFLSEIDKSALRIIGRVPYGFDEKSSGKNVSEKRMLRADGWEIGDKVFHDNQGYGMIIAIRAHGDEPVLVIRFETGKELSFLSRHQSAKITKVNDE
jgi:DNA helicase-2/ATP-dependent DNA helicase PcrA